MNVQPKKKPYTKPQLERIGKARRSRKIGFKICRKCKRQKPAEAFDRYARGSLHMKCRQCDADKPKRRCNRCKQVKTHDEFNRIRNGARYTRCSKLCKDCYTPDPQSRICEGCNERLAIELFGVRSSFDKRMQKLKFCRKTTCLQCEEERQQPLRTCKICGKKKPGEDFHRIIRTDHARRCKACPVEGHKGSGLRSLNQLPKPCATCKEVMWTYRPLHMVGDVKYCSKSCFRIGTAPPSIECVQCREFKPRTHFQRRTPNGVRVLKVCEQCTQEGANARVEMRTGSYSTVDQMRNQRKRAERNNADFVLTYRQAHALLAGPCYLCRASADVLHPMLPNARCDERTMRGLCLDCRHFMGARTLAATEQFVRKIATARGWSAESAQSKPLKKLKRPLEPAPPKGMRRCDMVPPEVHGAPIVGESWEERVARFARAKGPVNSKRKPGEDTQDG